jgi:peptide/nickel transport system permease protein
MAGPRMASPSWEHWMGTDQLGRDTFSRVVMGGRVAFLVALASLGTALTVGLMLGLLAGFGPQWLDNGFLLLFDGVRAFPVIIFGLATVTLMGPSLWTVIFVVAVTSIPIYARIVRTQTQALKNNEFILAERAMGASTPRILVVHILPNVIGPLLILASMDVPLVITTEAGLSFLGMGVRPPTPSWGTILNDGYNYIRNSPWPVIAGGIPLIITTLGFTFLGEALRDIFDPKLRKDL